MRGQRSGKAGWERQRRVEALLQKRLSGLSLFDIGQQETPPCSAQNIHSLISKALRDLPKQPLDQLRALEAHRLDLMTEKLWPAVLMADLAAIATVLRIMGRRAQLLGLDKQPGFGLHGGEGDSDGDRVIKLVVEGSPEVSKMEFLERRVRELEAGGTPTTTTLN